MLDNIILDVIVIAAVIASHDDAKMEHDTQGHALFVFFSDAEESPWRTVVDDVQAGEALDQYLYEMGQFRAADERMLRAMN